MPQFADLPRADSCRRIDFTKAEIHPVSVTGVPLLVVTGTKPYVNMEVNLVPLMYIQRPEYWGIEVVGCLYGIGLPTSVTYVVSIPLAGYTGTKGIEVIGPARSEKKDLT